MRLAMILPAEVSWKSTGSPSSKYEHWRASALLRNIQNIRICMGKNPITLQRSQRADRSDNDC